MPSIGMRQRRDGITRTAEIVIETDFAAIYTSLDYVSTLVAMYDHSLGYASLLVRCRVRNVSTVEQEDAFPRLAMQPCLIVRDRTILAATAIDSDRRRFARTRVEHASHPSRECLDDDIYSRTTRLNFGGGNGQGMKSAGRRKKNRIHDDTSRIIGREMGRVYGPNAPQSPRRHAWNGWSSSIPDAFGTLTMLRFINIRMTSGLRYDATLDIGALRVLYIYILQ